MNSKEPLVSSYEYVRLSPKQYTSISYRKQTKYLKIIEFFVLIITYYSRGTNMASFVRSNYDLKYRDPNTCAISNTFNYLLAT